MSARREDALATGAGLAFADLWASGSDASRAMGVHRSTPCRWSQGDKSNPVYIAVKRLLAGPDNTLPRILSFFKAAIKQRCVENLSTADLIERYKDVRVMEKRLELADTLADMEQLGWAHMASASEKDAALDEEKAAIEREFQARGVKMQEVFG